jgi:large subunit ribosomal protein L29
MKSKAWLEIKSMAPIELETKLRETKDKLFRIKFRHSSTPVRNGLEIRQLRRLVAKLNTLLKENSMASKGSVQTK